MRRFHLTRCLMVVAPFRLEGGKGGCQAKVIGGRGRRLGTCFCTVLHTVDSHVGDGIFTRNCAFDTRLHFFFRLCCGPTIPHRRFILEDVGVAGMGSIGRSISLNSPEMEAPKWMTGTPVHSSRSTSCDGKVFGGDRSGVAADLGMRRAVTATQPRPHHSRYHTLPLLSISARWC
jgi:hypothetical protein